MLQPPKKKSAKSAKGKGRKVEDALTNEDEQVERQVIQIHEQLEQERKECTYFQVERNTLNTFWEIAKKQLEEKKADLRSKEREIEETKENHLTDIRVYKQKFKHLLYEQQSSIAELKTEGVVAIQLQEKEYADEEHELRRGIQKLKVYLKEQELNHKNLTKELNLKHDGEISQMRDIFEAKAQEIEVAFEKKMQKQRQEEDLRRKTEIREIEQRKSIHVSKLIKDHEQAFISIKNYYNDLIPESATQISSLTEEVADMKTMKGRLKLEMARAQQQNKGLTEKLEKARKEVSDLQKQLANYKRDKALLAGLKANLRVANTELKDVKWENEVLRQIFSKVQQERDELYQKFTEAILEVQQKSSFTKLLLEKKLDALTDTLEKKEMQLNEVLAASNLEPRALKMVTHKLEPPKKKGTKSAKGKSSTVVDGISTEEMSKEQLEEHIIRLREELDREREERNYFQLERDKIHTFWEITKRQLEEKKADLRNREREMEEAEENHQTEIRVYKQKVKHLLYEQQNSIAELKTEGVVATKLLEKEQADHENELRRGIRGLKVDLKEQELSNENYIKNLKLVGAGYEIEATYEKKMQKQRQEQDLRRKTEIHEIEQRKSIHVNTLIKNHEKAFSDIKNYYSDITLGSINQISLLKEQVADMKKREERMETEMAEVRQQNKNLTEPLQKATQEVNELQKQLANYKKDKNLLALQHERDELYQKFTKAILEVQQKSSFKNLLLERKLNALTFSLEKKEAQLNEVLAASNLEPSALNMVTRKLEEVLDSKNTAIKDLQYELARTCKAHNDLLRTYEAKLKAFGIPTDEMGFKPLESSLVT
ncbi:Growth arrest-specific protein 8 [Bagarius yarrelli]|uniref:Dynein regulatory complex subunit 4 n=1 Tax=Bagarius yarrelli TaxID=175774 RepID=A0A556TZK0_BAGYA|nr:Growth arrest-specific protein 8 [Bagarius yarrelli]